MRDLVFEEFELGFWHPFGPHCGESRDEITDRKRREIESNGWTLWCFQHRRMLDDFARELSSARPQEVLVFCSNGTNAVDPAAGLHSKTFECTQYKMFGADKCQPIQGFRVFHPSSSPKRRLASAFVVQEIYYPIKLPRRPCAEWFRKDGSWCPQEVPTRGEYLIRRGGTVPLRDIRAILVLRPPYLALVW
jgi:hypothetical protein